MLIFVNEKQEEKTPKWMLILRAILIATCIMLTFALVAVYANQARADYSYQSYFSQFKEVWTDCIDNVVYKDVQVGNVDNTAEIEASKKEIARLQDLLSRLQTKTDALILDHGKPIYETREIASQVCTERTVIKPYCGDGIVNNKEQCDGSPNCSYTCTCNPWFLLMSSNSCLAIPMSENKEPELMRTGADPKKK